MTGSRRRRPAALVLASLIAVLPSRSHAQEPADTSPPLIDFRPCEAFQKDHPFSVAARFADESEIFEPKLVYHLANEKTWKHVTFIREGDVWRATIPKNELTGAIEYFVEVFDENGNGPSRMGSPDAPLFARAVKRAPECPLEGAIESPDVVEEHVAGPEEAMAVTVQDKGGGFLARCEAGEPDKPFYCKRWVWYAAGGALLATLGIIILASSGGGRDYPDRVDFEIRAQGLEFR